MAEEEESVVDNWEDADTEELERRMEERHKQLQPIKVVKIKARPPTEQTQAPPPSSTSEPQTQLPLKIQDSDRTEYVAPIKILKRKSDGSPPTHPTSAHAPSTKQYKTLAEREAEYASARARILGSDYRSGESSTNSPPQGRATSAGSAVKTSNNDVINRQPKGPNGSKGFTKTS
ncbi:SUZ domain-containing protein 1-like [Halichondria panicea]|uniref:SUZ domain-containing protein 1-like n=1 Tax=Halichondria panicea TaxID=6063 RepID=UPI00312BB08C